MMMMVGMLLFVVVGVRNGVKMTCVSSRRIFLLENSNSFVEPFCHSARPRAIPVPQDVSVTMSGIAQLLRSPTTCTRQQHSFIYYYNL